MNKITDYVNKNEFGEIRGKIFKDENIMIDWFNDNNISYDNLSCYFNNTTIGVITYIEVWESYRKGGFGSELLLECLSYFDLNKVDYIFVNAKTNYENYNGYILDVWFKDFGFKKISGEDNKDNLMIMSI